MIITAKNGNHKIFLKSVKYLKHSLIKVIQLFWNRRLSGGVDYHELIFKTKLVCLQISLYTKDHLIFVFQ